MTNRSAVHALPSTGCAPTQLARDDPHRPTTQNYAAHDPGTPVQDGECVCAGALGEHPCKTKHADRTDPPPWTITYTCTTSKGNLSPERAPVEAFSVPTYIFDDGPSVAAQPFILDAEWRLSSTLSPHRNESSTPNSGVAPLPSQSLSPRADSSVPSRHARVVTSPVVVVACCIRNRRCMSPSGIDPGRQQPHHPR